VVDVWVGDYQVLDVGDGEVALGQPRNEFRAGVLAGHDRVEQDRFRTVDQIRRDVARRPVDAALDPLDDRRLASLLRVLLTHYREQQS